ncbi:response regulator [Bdellovibrio sp. KM01]|uniref:response regulator n=1 Tax=Bdellovibrio sp. KM01 TaxID=2748865 RepID=UPI0015EA8537|nr:response regulator [Bdellovibrio sp. KM01]QLY26424.1 response regulator [Bdellovibrio sp. KM01]
MAALEERILILASTARDSESTHKILTEANLCPCICRDFDDLLEKINEGAGALLLAKEVLIPQNQERIKSSLSIQPSWSDLPIIILASAGDLTQGKKETLEVLKSLRNATVLERPIRVATLVNVLESSIANRRRQYEVRDLVRLLVVARQEAETAKAESDQANKAKSEFLANMSHEIRTPLGIIIGFSSLAEDENASAEERQTYLNTIQRNGNLLLDLVNDILDLAKVEAGHMAIEEVDTSITDILNDIVLGLKPKAAEKNIQLITKIPDNFPANLKTDPTRVRQIFLNVIGNAVKFTKYGSVTAELSFKITNSNHIEVNLLVTDTGLGITDEQRLKLFKPFTQADGSTTREYGGTGLGLVLSRNLANALGGSLELVESQQNVGSTFKITVMAKQAMEVQNSTAENVTKPQATFKGLGILVAEDSPDNQFLLSRLLKQEGMTVDLANNGLEAITKASNNQYDIILMDIQMPKMDGNKATSYLRQSGYSKPIIALTANALKGDKEKALASGFDDYITKPIQRTELFDSLEKVIRNV